MMDPKEAYSYQNYVAKIEKAKIRSVPKVEYSLGCNQYRDLPDNETTLMAYGFMENARNSSDNADFDNLLKRKTELSEDKVDLILHEISGRGNVNYRNLKSLYEDLLKIDNWRLQRPYPEKYLKDRVWSDLNKMEFLLWDQIRRELKDFSRDTAFPQKDLRESLLEFKLQDQKSKMLDMDDLEHSLAANPDGYNQQTGDLNRQKTMY